MGNEINESHKKTTIEDNHLIFPGYSNKISNQTKKSVNNSTVEIVDKEDITISQIIEAKLNKDANKEFLYLEDYVIYLSSQSKPNKFTIKDFEDITEFVMKYKEKPLDFLLQCYHRSIDLIEIKSRDEYNDSYK